MGRNVRNLPATMDAAEPLSGELNAAQQRFVEEYVASGGKLAAAAKAAGYSARSAGQTASRLIRNPLVAQAVYAETLKAVGRHAPAALASMARLSTRAKSELVRMQAAADVLDRAGFKPVDRHQVALGGEISVAIDLSGA